MARLLVTLQGAEFSFDLRGDAVRVGSSAGNGLVLKDPQVGREHLEIRRLGTSWRLLDLESVAGTRVNGLFVNRHDLKDGDVIAVGAARLTFRGEDPAVPAPIPAPRAGAVPAPIPAAVPAPIPAPIPVAGAVPAPVPAPAPWAAPQAWASQGYAPPPAGYAPPPAPYAPVPAPPAPPPGRRPAPPHDREERDRWRPSRGRSGGGGGAAVLLLALLFGGAIVVWAVLPREEPRKDPNVALLLQIKGYEAQGKWDEIVGLEALADRAWPGTFKEVAWKVEEARRAQEALRIASSRQEADAYYESQIRALRDAGEDRTLVPRCDEFLRRFPGHARFDEVGLLRLRLTGEPSPIWQEAKGGSAPGKGGFVSVSTLLTAADQEAWRQMNGGDYTAALGVYDRFVAHSARTVTPAYMESFGAEVGKARKFITDKAKEAFERLEERAMVLEDQKRFADAEALYREARAKFGVPEITARCDAELERLRGDRR